MRTIARFFVALTVVAAASVVSGALPKMNVSVLDSTGKSAYKGATDAKGLFATPKLQPGNYAVQFTSNNAPKGSHYTLVVVAGAKKMSASVITAEKLAAGGVAMKIEVAAGTNIQGQVSAEDQAMRMGKNGKPMVWIPKKVGSNIPAHWAESDSAEAKEAETAGSYSTKNLQDKQNQGISPH
jgi:outer membrane usher protein FimD/PapC